MSSENRTKIHVKPKKSKRPPPPNFPPDINHENASKVSEEKHLDIDVIDTAADAHISPIVHSVAGYDAGIEESLTSSRQSQSQIHQEVKHLDIGVIDTVADAHNSPIVHSVPGYDAGIEESLTSSRQSQSQVHQESYRSVPVKYDVLSVPEYDSLRTEHSPNRRRPHDYREQHSIYPPTDRVAPSEPPTNWGYQPYSMQGRLYQHQYRHPGQSPHVYDYNAMPPQGRYTNYAPYDYSRAYLPPKHVYQTASINANGPTSHYDRPFQPYIDSDYQHRPLPSGPPPPRPSPSDELGENNPTTFSITPLSKSEISPRPEEVSDSSESKSDGETTREDPIPVKNCFISPEKSEEHKGLTIVDPNTVNQAIHNDQKLPIPKPSQPMKVFKNKGAKFTGYKKCLIMRDRKGVKNRLNPTYHLYSQDVAPGTPPQLIMIAQKASSRTSNYRFYDMNKGGTTDKLDKHSRNYVGKLRGNFNRDEYTIYGRVKKEIVGAVVYDKGNMLTTVRDGALPRKMGVLLPLDKVVKQLEPVNREINGKEETKRDDVYSPRQSVEERLACMFSQVEGKIQSHEEIQRVTTSVANLIQGKLGVNSTSKQYLQLSSKEPKYEKKNYRLNFHGRVKLPSVKNYQLIQSEDEDNVWTQFGKVTEDKFHLDYKEPMDLFTAFAVAVTQFDY